MGTFDNESGPPRFRPRGENQEYLRIRAAWLYYVEGVTQSEAARILGVNRILITRLLADARQRGEVIVRIKSELAPLIELERKLENLFGLERAIIAPLVDPLADPTRLIAAAAGEYIPTVMENNLTIGVGWGRTLHSILPFMEGMPLQNVKIISLLGGIVQAKRLNPAGFAWQFAGLFDAEAFLIPAPAIVDSADTKHSLYEYCGLEQLFHLAEHCDIALISCGGISSLSTSYVLGNVSEEMRKSLIEMGAVGDVLFNFLAPDGTIVDHPINKRCVSMPIESLKRLDKKVLISGGPNKTEIIKATMKAIKPTTFITDEQTAKRIIKGR